MGENGITAAVSTMAQNPNNRGAEKALASFHMKQRLVFSYIYELPFGKGKPWLSSGAGCANSRRLARRWRHQPARRQSHQRTDGHQQSEHRHVPAAESYLRRKSPQLRTVRLAAGSILPVSWRPPTFAFGNAGRNILIAPHIYNWDASLQRTFPVTERMRFELRAEYFNVFNTPQFYPPLNQLGNADFATLTAIRGGSNRQGQVALKFVF